MNTSKLDNVEVKIVDSMDKINNDWKSIGEDDGSWTEAINISLSKLGKSLGYEVYTKNCKFATDGEWLYDISWTIDDGEYIQELILALESEWYPNGILDDFQKLIVSIANYRVMIYWENNIVKANKLLRMFKKQVNMYKATQSGDRYLFIRWIEGQDPIDYFLYVVP